MSKHRFELELEIDDEKLSAHPGLKIPPPNDPSNWEPQDLVTAIELGFVNIYVAEFTDYTCLER